MEDVYYIAAIVSFVLAACSLVTCVTIFFRAHVLDAIRFLQHKPVSAVKRGAVTIPTAAPKHRRSEGGRGSDSSRGVQPAPDCESSESATDVLAVEASERGTDLLDGESSERPTGLLSEDGAESPTGLLSCPDSERSTDLLRGGDSERPTGLLADEASENPTGILVDEASERPTGLLCGEPEKIEEHENGIVRNEKDVAQQEETVFRFMLKHHEIVVHTRETIA